MYAIGRVCVWQTASKKAQPQLYGYTQVVGMRKQSVYASPRVTLPNSFRIHLVPFVTLVFMREWCI